MEKLSILDETVNGQRIEIIARSLRFIREDSVMKISVPILQLYNLYKFTFDTKMEKD